jgi:protein-tyrosine kinase
MSRIHEALKKAQLEREASGRQAGVNHPESAAGPSTAVFPRAEAPGDAVATPITYDSLMSRCPAQSWSMDSKLEQILGSSNHIAGTEELRTLRSRLYQIRERQPLKCLLIGSALPAEGKTFLAASLAHMIVRQHERTAVLIDADMRRPQLHNLLGAVEAPGLSDYLKGTADEFEVLHRGPTPNLFLVPSGAHVSNPAELLAGERLQTLLDRLAQAFDWVILDSPPAVPVADASRLADHCDGVLLIVRAGATPLDAAQKARMEFLDKRLLGVVLNCVEHAHAYSSYYYGAYGAEAQKAD